MPPASLAHGDIPPQLTTSECFPLASVRTFKLLTLISELVFYLATVFHSNTHILTYWKTKVYLPEVLASCFFLFLLCAVKSRKGTTTCSGTWALPNSIGIFVSYGFTRLGRLSMH